MDELLLKPVSPKVASNRRSRIYRSVPCLYIDDLRAIYKVLWDLTEAARNGRTAKIEAYRKKIDSFRELANKQGYEPSWDSIAYYEEEIESLSSEKDIEMESDEYIFESLDQLETIRREVVPEFRMSLRYPYACTLWIRPRGGVYFSWEDTEKQPATQISRIEKVIDRRRNPILRFLLEGSGLPILFAMVILAGWLVWRTRSDGTIPFTASGILFLVVFTALGWTAAHIGEGVTTRFIPQYSVDVRNKWRERTPEIILGVLTLIATVLGSIAAFL